MRSAGQDNNNKWNSDTFMSDTDTIQPGTVSLFLERNYVSEDENHSSLQLIEDHGSEIFNQTINNEEDNVSFGNGNLNLTDVQQIQHLDVQLNCLLIEMDNEIHNQDFDYKGFRSGIAKTYDEMAHKLSNKLKFKR